MIVTDASVWVSYFVPHDVHNAASRRWLTDQSSTSRLLIAPVLLLSEIAGAVARVTGESWLGRQAARDLLRLPELRLVSVDSRLGRLASIMAADLKLRGMDAVYVAVAQGLGIPLVTWDREQHDRGAQVVTTYTPAMSI